MTKEKLAARLNGREYGSEITRDEEKSAKKSGLVVVFGASDDLMEFRGAIYDEVDAYDGATVRLAGGKLFPKHSCNCAHCGYTAVSATAKPIKACWCDDETKQDFTWTFRTEIPHATFEILEDGEQYCRGIVFNVSEVT